MNSQTKNLFSNPSHNITFTRVGISSPDEVTTYAAVASGSKEQLPGESNAAFRSRRISEGIRASQKRRKNEQKRIFPKAGGGMASASESRLPSDPDSSDSDQPLSPPMKRPAMPKTVRQTVSALERKLEETTLKLRTERSTRLAVAAELAALKRSYTELEEQASTRYDALSAEVAKLREEIATLQRTSSPVTTDAPTQPTTGQVAMEGQVEQQGTQPKKPKQQTLKQQPTPKPQQQQKKQQQAQKKQPQLQQQKQGQQQRQPQQHRSTLQRKQPQQQQPLAQQQKQPQPQPRKEQTRPKPSSVKQRPVLPAGHTKEVVVVPLTEGTTYAAALGVLRSHIQKQTADYKIMGTRATKDKNLLIQLSGRGQAATLAAALVSKIEGAQPRACVPVVSLHIGGVEPDLSTEDISNVLSTLCAVATPVRLQLLGATKEGKLNYKAIVDRLLAERALAKGSLQIGWGKCRVRLFTEAPRRCPHCHRIGAHKPQECPASSTSRHGACVLCGAAEHRTNECKATGDKLMCQDCLHASGETPCDPHHRSGTKECSHYRQLLAKAKSSLRKQTTKKTQTSTTRSKPTPDADGFTTVTRRGGRRKKNATSDGSQS